MLFENAAIQYQSTLALESETFPAQTERSGVAEVAGGVVQQLVVGRVVATSRRRSGTPEEKVPKFPRLLL